MSGTATRRQLALFVHLPTGLLGLATGASAPVVPLAALAHGASVTEAALVVAAGGVGTLLADLPAGRLVAQFGERITVAFGTLIGVAGAVLCLLDASLLMLTVGVGLLGLAQAVWGLARQSYLTVAVPLERRARAISAMAGMYRLGMLVGPFAGAAVLTSGHTQPVFAVQLAAVLLGGCLLAGLRDTGGRCTGTRLPIATTARRERRSLLRLGPAAFALGSLRASRMVILPLWAERLGMDAASIALLFGIAAALDVVLSYPSGMALDRLGRRAMAVPATGLFGAGLLLLPLAGSPTALWLVAILIGAANGLTNGLVMTIGADISPPDARPQFLSLWRLLHDAGTAGSPAAIGALTALAGLSAAAVGIGLVGLAGAVVFARNLPPGRPALHEEATVTGVAVPRTAPAVPG